jgi:hypothetical protein
VGTNTLDRSKKVLVVGLDYAGKTSILGVLNQEYHKLDKMKPTTGIERKIVQILGDTIAIWDLGGQEKYRSGYLSDIRTFAETSSLFFVVDIQTPARFEFALQYFSTILIMIESLGIKPHISILLHKVDPDIQNNPKTQASIKKARELFLTNSRGHELSIFTTSIFDTKSIVRAFLNTLEALLKSVQPFKQILETLCIQLGLEGAMLFNENLILLGEYYQDENCQEICLNEVFDNLKPLVPRPKDATFIQKFESQLNLNKEKTPFKFFRVKSKEWELHLLTVGKAELDENLINSLFTA